MTSLVLLKEERQKLNIDIAEIKIELEDTGQKLTNIRNKLQNVEQKLIRAEYALLNANSEVQIALQNAIDKQRIFLNSSKNLIELNNRVVDTRKKQRDTLAFIISYAKKNS